jgi:hypothetical protein
MAHAGAIDIRCCPFTLLVIKPTNQKLLDPAIDRSCNTGKA